MQIINLDLEKRDGFNKAITVRRGESGGTFGIKLFDGGLLYQKKTGDTFTFKGLTPNGNYVAKAGTMQADGTVQIVLDGQVTSQAGYYKRAYLEVKNGTTVRTTQDIIFFSLGNSDISRGQAEYYVSELDKLLQQLNNEFDEWLKDREQDYADLLARLVALTNRVTNLETKLDDIIAQLQANEINTTNVFDSSLILMPESNVRRRVNGQTIDIRVWGAALLNNASLIAMFEPNKTYHAKYTAELLTLTGGDPTVAGHFGMAIYSGKTGFPTVWLTQSTTPAEVAPMKVGDTIVMEKTFTTPAELYDPAAGYQLLVYGRRSGDGVIDAARLHDIMIQEGSMFTGLETNPDNTLTKFDENRLKKSILVDPKMSGLNQPTIEGGTGTPTTEVTYLTAGIMQVKNLLDTGRARVFWTATQLGIDSADALGAFEIRVKMRQSTPTSATIVEMGYSGGGDNATFNVDASATWKVYTATVKPNTNSAFCIYIDKGVTIQIQELYIYPAGTDVTSKRVERIEDGLPDVKKMVTGTPDSLSGADANTLFNSGVWKIYGGVNMPPSIAGTYFYLRVINFNVNNCLQIASLREGAGVPSNPNYVRQCVNGTWQEWRTFDTLPSDRRVDTIADDFNNQKTTGQYVITTTSNSPTGAASTSWYLEVIRYGSSGNYILQKATQISNTNRATYQRQFFNGAWTQWDLVAANNVPITDTNDANLYVTTQNILLRDAAASNLPTTTGSNYYYVEVIARAANYVMQRATLRGLTDETYTRQNVNNVWTAWRKVDKNIYLPPIDLTYKTGWRNHNEGTDMKAWNYARAERRGDTVWVYGAVSNTVNYTPSATATIVATLPEGYRPKDPVRGNISRSSGRTMFTLEAQTNGDIMVGTMVDPGVNGYAGEQTPGKIFHISMSFPAEEL